MEDNFIVVLFISRREKYKTNIFQIIIFSYLKLDFGLIP